MGKRGPAWLPAECWGGPATTSWSPQASIPQPAHWSRACTERVSVVDPRQDPARFTEEVESLAASRGVDMLLPGSDATLLALACHGDPSRSGIWSKVPPPNAIKRALDKVALIDCAEQIGHPGPPTVVCRDLGQAIAAADAFGYPVVLKPRRSVSEHDGTLLQRPGVLVRDTATLERLAAELGTPCLVQRRENRLDRVARRSHRWRATAGGGGEPIYPDLARSCRIGLLLGNDPIHARTQGDRRRLRHEPRMGRHLRA